MTRARLVPVTPGDDRAQELSGALHEVSNALTVVLGWLEVARSKLPPGAERDALDIAQTHARLGYGIARQAIGAEVPGSAPGQSSARSTARTAATGVTPEATRRGVQLVLDASSASSAQIGSVGAALQILTNLLLNAIAFTPRGREVRLGVHADGTHAIFSVRDEGPGIPEDRAQSIFTGPVSTRRGGAGVGLRHSHSLAELHGGSLSVISDAGAGACFELRWPVAEARSSTRPQEPIYAGVSGARVLVLEDDAAVRSLLELALEARGAETVLVASRAEFERVLVNGRFDLALVDLSPIADCCAAMLARLHAANPGVAVILISGIASGVPDGIANDVASWVRKPFEMGEVLSEMARLLQSQRALLEADTAAG